MEEYKNIYVDESKPDLKDIEKELEDLKVEFQSKLKYDSHKDKIIDLLHEKLEDYRQDLLRKLIRPLIFDIIYTMDNIDKISKVYKSKEIRELDPVKMIKAIDGIREDLEDVLYRQGVESFKLEGPFDAEKQKIVKVIETPKEEKERTVARSIKKGFIWDKKVIREEQVSVYVYKPKEKMEKVEISNNKYKISNIE